MKTRRVLICECSECIFCKVLFAVRKAHRTMQELMIMRVWVDLSMIYKRAHFQINDSEKHNITQTNFSETDRLSRFLNTSNRATLSTQKTSNTALSYENWFEKKKEKKGKFFRLNYDRFRNENFIDRRSRRKDAESESQADCDRRST